MNIKDVTTQLNTVRGKLEKSMFDMISLYETETGLKVNSIELIRIPKIGERNSPLFSVQIKVEL